MLDKYIFENRIEAHEAVLELREKTGDTRWYWASSNCECKYCKSAIVKFEIVYYIPPYNHYVRCKGLVSAACDCGGKKLKLPHSHWCSSNT